jgi:hypothetical protein
LVTVILSEKFQAKSTVHLATIPVEAEGSSFIENMPSLP